jgi:hypothetical protein
MGGEGRGRGRGRHADRLSALPLSIILPSYFSPPPHLLGVSVRPAAVALLRQVAVGAQMAPLPAVVADLHLGPMHIMSKLHIMSILAGFKTEWA